MPCNDPIQAWRAVDGSKVNLGREFNDSRPIALPCGKCLGCRMARARGWALRCWLELQDHEHAAFVTLTYSDEHNPLTLSKKHLQTYNKRLRKQLAKKNRKMRFFASGEYGEHTSRPHYHIIMYGVGEREKRLIQDPWPWGRAHAARATPAAITYVAGYTVDKLRELKRIPEVDYRTGEIINYDTGEIIEWQQPFIQMSRRPGVGAKYAQQTSGSWSDFAILNGQRISVPKYLHEIWEESVTEEEKEEKQYEKWTKAKRRTKEELWAEEQIMRAKQKMREARRKL